MPPPGSRSSGRLVHYPGVSRTLFRSIQRDVNRGFTPAEQKLWNARNPPKKVQAHAGANGAAAAATLPSHGVASLPVFFAA